MSTAYYPLGMRPTPASGYNHKSSFPDEYRSWKGVGLSKTPTGVTSGSIRPLTNKDYGNVFQGAFGKARPIKHYRKGVIPHIQVTDLNSTESDAEGLELDRNLNRVVSSSTPGTLVKQMIDVPGGFSVKKNTLVQDNIKPCQGICVSANYYPNLPYLTENPTATTTSRTFCCNEEKKALKRCRPASTNLNKNYYTTHTQYMENRCQTYKQRVFNFLGPEERSEAVAKGKPGQPGMSSLYIANCYPNGEIDSTSEEALVKKVLKVYSDNNLPSPSDITTFKQLFDLVKLTAEPEKSKMIEIYDAIILNPYTGMPITGPSNPKSCKFVIYKPSNYQFANEGAVSSSTLNLAKNRNTIDTNLARLAKNEILFKNKTEPCNPVYYTKNGNSTSCQRKNLRDLQAPTP